MHSLWEQTPASSSFETLRQDIETDVLIIGGGMAGVLCAYLLQQAGVSYIGRIQEERRIYMLPPGLINGG